MALGICTPKKSNVVYVCGLFGWVVIYLVFVAIGGLCMMRIEKEHDSQLKNEKTKQFFKSFVKI